MKKLQVLLLLLGILPNAMAQSNWSLDKAHSKVGFTVTHNLISEVDGYFKVFNASLTSSKDDFSDAVFELTAEASSVNTENEMRDNDLRSPGFFEVEKFSTITFKSTSFKKEGENKYTLKGDLTIKGVTKPITMEVTLMSTTHPRTKKPMIGIKATTTINRKDFGVGPNLPEIIVSNEVMLKATGEFNQK